MTCVFDYSTLNLVMEYFTDDFSKICSILTSIDQASLQYFNVTNFELTAREWHKYKKYMLTSPRKIMYDFMPNESLQSTLDSLPYLESIKFGDCFNEPLLEQNAIEFPPTLRSVEFGVSFNHPLPPSLQSHPGITHLKFGKFFNQPLSTLPPALQLIEFGDRFNQPLVMGWPASLHTIILSTEFTSLLKQFPPSLTCLKFGFKYLGSIHHMQLPSIKTLCFHESYSHSFVNYRFPSSLTELKVGFANCLNVHFPPNLKSLTFGILYNHPLNGVVFPNSVTSITMGHTLINTVDFQHILAGWDHPLQGVVWPSSLTELDLSKKFNKPLSGAVFPASLTRIVLGENYSQSNAGVEWPPNLSVLENCYDVLNMPPNLTRLSFSDAFIGSDKVHSALPLKLKSLSFSDNFNSEFDGSNLTELTELVFGSAFDRDFVAPPNLKILNMGGYNQPVVAYHSNNEGLLGSEQQSCDRLFLPLSLEVLEFGDRFNQPILGFFYLANLKRLKFGSSFNQPLNVCIFPISLTSLEVGNAFDQPMDFVDFYTELKELKFGDNFSHPIVKMPYSLERLEVGNAFTHSIGQVMLKNQVAIKHIQFGVEYRKGLVGNSLRTLRYGPKSIKKMIDVFLPVQAERDLPKAVRAKRKFECVA